MGRKELSGDALMFGGFHRVKKKMESPFTPSPSKHGTSQADTPGSANSKSARRRQRKKKSVIAKSQGSAAPVQAAVHATHVAPTQSRSFGLKYIQHMFPAVDSFVVEHVFQLCGSSTERTIDYLLRETGHQPEVGGTTDQSSDKAPGNKNGCPDPLGALPMDAFFKICDYLDIFGVGVLSVLSRECHRQAAEVQSKVTQLTFTRFRSWPDQKILGMIACFPNLTSLSLRKCENFLSFVALPSACANPCLTSLNLADCPELTTDDVCILVGFLSNLESLDLSHSYISDYCLESIALKGSNLQRLVLAHCSQITCTGLRLLMDRMKSLTHLDLKSTNISQDISFQCFPDQDNQILSLNLSKCSRLHNFILGMPADGHYSTLPHLSNLSMSSVPHLTHVTLNLPSIMHLNLSSCRNLRRLELGHCPLLQELNLSGCILLEDILIEPSPGTKRPPTSDETPRAIVAGQESDEARAQCTTQACTSLNTVNIFQCRSLRITSLHRVVEASRNSLVTLNAEGLIQMEAFTLQKIIDDCSRLCHLTLPAPRRGGDITAELIQRAYHVAQNNMRNTVFSTLPDALNFAAMSLYADNS